MQIVQRAIGNITPYAHNPRNNQASVAKVAASIEAFGFKQPIVVDSKDVIVVGHTRWLAAQQLGLAEVPVLVADDLSPAQARAYRLADNRTAQESTWDEDLLAQELQALLAQQEEGGTSVSATGFSLEEITQLTDCFKEGVGKEENPDACPDVPKTPICQRGQLWQLGSHRLLCGDATLAEDVNRLLGGECAALGFSDPPYNVNYIGYTPSKLQLAGDKQTPADFSFFLEQIFKNYHRALTHTASLYVCHPTLGARSFQEALEQAGFSLRSSLVWAKQHFAWGRSRYKYQHEPIYYCYKTGEVDAWYGDATQSTLWAFDKPSANRLHPTMKPVALIEKVLQNSSQAGDYVVDLLAGSGSTLMACEHLGRKCYAMEIDPRYCDVIIKRWEAFTGQTAVLCPSSLPLEKVML